MKRILQILILLLSSTTIACAQSTTQLVFGQYVAGLPAATVPLAGTELLYILQGGTSKSTSVVNVAAQVLPSLGLSQGGLTLVSGGHGYNIGDTVTLACTGYTFSTNPVIGVVLVSGNVITSSVVIRSGVTTGVGASAAPCSQASTTGTGSGATWTVWIQPQTLFASLGTGGSGNANGDTFLGAETPSSTFSGSEATFVGDRAGGAFVSQAQFNTGVGHNACGIGGSPAPTGNGNTCLGTDAGRNISGAAASNTLIGNMAGGNNSPANNLSGNDSTIVGAQAGFNLTTGGSNTLIGFAVAPTLTTGSGNIIIGTSSSCDATSAGMSNTTIICAGNTNSLSMAAGSDLTISAGTGFLILSGKMTFSPSGAGAASQYVCADASNHIVVQAGAC